MSTPFDRHWLEMGACVPVDIETMAALVSEIHRLIDVIDVIGGMALSQPEQEPVAWHTEDHLTDRSATTYSKDMVYRWECKGWPVTPLYTTPPQPKREWVGLTDMEKKQFYTEVDDWDEVVDWVEAKLKEKNT